MVMMMMVMVVLMMMVLMMMIMMTVMMIVLTIASASPLKIHYIFNLVPDNYDSHGKACSEGNISHA